MRKTLGIMLVFFVVLSLNTSAVIISGDNYTEDGTLYNEDVIITGFENAVFNNIIFNGTLVINDTLNVRINRSKILVNISTTNARGIVDASYSWFNTDYAPLADNVSRGCDDGTGSFVDENITATPWYRVENMSDSSGNCKPVMDDIIDQTGNIGYLWTVTVFCKDWNSGDSIAYTDDTVLFIVDASTGIMTYTPPGTVDEDINVTCSDTEYIDSDLFNLLVVAGSGYVDSYAGEDISSIIIDLIVGIGANIFSFIALIALILIVIFVFINMKNSKIKV